MAGISVALLCGSSVQAQPFAYIRQHFAQQITFGDSISDAGNSYALAGVPPLGPPPPMGSDQGRYSNGPMYPELLAPSFSLSAPGLLGGTITPAAGIDFAVGGSLSGSEPLDLAHGSVPGAITQVQEYLGFTASGKVAPATSTTLYTVFTGGNDYTGYIGSLAGSSYPTLASMQAEVSVVQNNIATAVRQLAAGGAKTIVVVNQFDLGLVPIIRDPAAFGLPVGILPTYAATLGTQLTDLHNATLPQMLKQLEAQTGTRLIEVDVNALYRDAVYNPAIYSFTNVTSSCVGLNFVTAPANAPSCTTVSDASHVMFWQATHPGFTMQSLIAQLINGTLQTVLAGPQTIAVQSRLGLIAEQGLWQVAQRRSEVRATSGFRLFAESGYGTGNRDETATRAGYAYDRYGFALGGEYGFSRHVYVGAAVGYDRTDAALAQGAGGLGLNSYGVSVYAGIHQHGWWGLTQVDGIYDDFGNISRASGLAYFPEARARTHGWTGGFGIEIGHAWKVAGLRMGPYGGYHLVHIGIHGYRETGTRLLNLDVATHGLTSQQGIFGLRVDGRTTLGRYRIRPMADIAYMHEFTAGNEAIAASLADGQDAAVLAATRARDLVAVNMGVRVAVARRWHAGISIGQDLVRAGGTDHSVKLQLSYRF